MVKETEPSPIKEKNTYTSLIEVSLRPKKRYQKGEQMPLDECIKLMAERTTRLMTSVEVYKICIDRANKRIEKLNFVRQGIQRLLGTDKEIEVVAKDNGNNGTFVIKVKEK